MGRRKNLYSNIAVHDVICFHFSQREVEEISKKLSIEPKKRQLEMGLLSHFEISLDDRIISTDKTNNKVAQFERFLKEALDSGQINNIVHMRNVIEQNCSKFGFSDEEKQNLLSKFCPSKEVKEFIL